MNEYEFNAKVEALLAERREGKIFALDLGRKFKELCAEYLKDNEHLPEAYSVFEDSTPYSE